MKFYLLLCTTSAFFATACTDDGTPGADTNDTKDTADIADTADITDTNDIVDTTDIADTNDTTDAVDTTDSGDSGDTADSFGFEMRVPRSRTLECEASQFGPDQIEQLDSDWICTFVYGGQSGHVYLQADPTECIVAFGALPGFGDCRGWIALDETVSAVSEVSYDWGGNHHNDSLSFTHDDKKFSFYHSSFGFGFRKCQEMDCLQVRDGTGTLIEDGCTKERTLPAVCSPVQADGTWAPLVDTFEPCPGDPNYPPPE